MKQVLKWYRILGGVIFLVGWVITTQLPSEVSTGSNAGTPLMIIGAIIGLADLVGRFLNIEVMMWTPLYEALGISIGLIMVLAGVTVFFCSGLASVGKGDVTPFLVGGGLILGGGIIAFASEGLKFHLHEKEKRKKKSKN